MLLFCEDELPPLDPEEPLLPPDELLLPELDAELWLLPELEAPLLELDEPLPLLLGADELGADELFELPEPLPELEGALELLLGPDELLELDEPLLELDELLEPEELLLLGPDELGGLLSELDELLDSELWLIGFSSAMLYPEAPCPSRPTGTTLTALIVLRRIEASQVFCISFLRSVYYYSQGMGDGWPCFVRRLASARMVAGREKCLHARNPKSKFRESGGGSIWSAEGQQGEQKIDAPSGAPQSELDSRVIWQGFETVMIFKIAPQICWEIRIVTANGAFSKYSLLPNPIVASNDAKADGQ